MSQQQNDYFVFFLINLLKRAASSTFAHVRHRGGLFSHQRHQKTLRNQAHRLSIEAIRRFSFNLSVCHFSVIGFWHRSDKSLFQLFVWQACMMVAGCFGKKRNKQKTHLFIPVCFPDFELHQNIFPLLTSFGLDLAKLCFRPGHALKYCYCVSKTSL